MDFTQAKPSEYEDQHFKNLDCPKQTIRFKTFYKCRFTQTAFNESQFHECTFRECLFTNCDLSLIGVKDCSFSQTRFEECKVIGVNWAQARWSKINLLGSAVDFNNCTLNYSTFTGLKLPKVRLSRCVARDVDFAEADLTGADCTGTDFSESRFLHTNLTEADFTGATNYAIAVNLNSVRKAKFSLPEAMSLLYSLDIILVE